jgi:hypothetical protein
VLALFATDGKVLQIALRGDREIEQRIHVVGHTHDSLVESMKVDCWLVGANLAEIDRTWAPLEVGHVRGDERRGSDPVDEGFGEFEFGCLPPMNRAVTHRFCHATDALLVLTHLFGGIDSSPRQNG